MCFKIKLICQRTERQQEVITDEDIDRPAGGQTNSWTNVQTYADGPTNKHTNW